MSRKILSISAFAALLCVASVSAQAAGGCGRGEHRGGGGCCRGNARVVARPRGRLGRCCCTGRRGLRAVTSLASATAPLLGLLSPSDELSKWVICQAANH